jgi:formylglycine-generating enzyme required for sulfatase activity
MLKANKYPPIAPKYTSTTNCYSFESVVLDHSGKVINRLPGQAQQLVENLGQGVQLEMISIPKGFFQMGSRHEGGYSDERPQHPVFLPSFWLGKHPITQAQWQAVMNSLPNCRFHGPDLPVETISWQDASEFCARLSKHTGRSYCLPSEAQWEYACRAGTATPFSFGESITTDWVNFVGDHTYGTAPTGIYRHGPTPIGTFAPNPWGLCDMHGNVWEFCQDTWVDDYVSAPVDGSARISLQAPAAPRFSFQQTDLFSALQFRLTRSENNPTRQSYRVARGGSWHETPTHCRSAMRLRVADNERLEYYGLRVMLAEL